MTTTFDGLRDIIVRDFELPPERLARDTPLEQIELDSLAVTELVFALEDEFHVTVQSAVPPFVTLGDIADYIDRLIVERDAGPPATSAPAPEATARASAPRSPARAANPQTPETPRKQRRTGSARSNGRAQ
jgi:acyl carrier protein